MTSTVLSDIGTKDVAFLYHVVCVGVEIDIPNITVLLHSFHYYIPKVNSKYVATSPIKNCYGVISWSLYGLCKLAQAAPPFPVKWLKNAILL